MSLSLPRFVLGAQPLEAGWKRALIRPHPASLTFANGQIPTPHGPILVDWQRDESFTLKLKLPAGITARVELPAVEGAQHVLLDGHAVEARLVGGRWIPANDVSGDAVLRVQ